MKEFILPLDLAMIRWSVVCGEWDRLSANSAPILSVFLAGWGWRCMGMDLPKNCGTFKDSFRVGYREADETISIRVGKCVECGTHFDSIQAGKLRMGESFCSLECADVAYPEFVK